MSRTTLIAFVLVWAGSALVLAETKVCSRPSLVQRLRPHIPTQQSGHPSKHITPGFWGQMGPSAVRVGERISRHLGVAETLETRLERIQYPTSAPEIRLRQLGAAGLALALALGAALALHLALGIVLLGAGGAPALAYLLIEHRFSSLSKSWQNRLADELPVLSEQLSILVSAGYSLSAALSQLARRAKGVGGQDLRRVHHRIGQGVSLDRALKEWAALADVASLTRLVPILAMDSFGADLGRLLAEEARSMRKEAQRKTASLMDKRAQAVWIPVTVATLVPGVIVLAVPFIEALRLFSNP